MTARGVLRGASSSWMTLYALGFGTQAGAPANGATTGVGASDAREPRVARSTGTMAYSGSLRAHREP